MEEEGEREVQEVLEVSSLLPSKVALVVVFPPRVGAVDPSSRAQVDPQVGEVAGCWGY